MYTPGTSSLQKQLPEVLRFDAVLFQDHGKMRLEIPAGISRKLLTMEKVEGLINGQPFRAVIDTTNNETYVLHVSSAMLRGAGADTGDTVTLAILGPEPDPVPPEDLQREFDISPEAEENWEKLTTLGKRDWIRWIDDTKVSETRARRIARTIDQLSEGKRRACCVNVNAFMMYCIKEDEAKKA